MQECNLYQLMKTCQGLLPEQLVREWCATIFQGLAYIHEKGYFHRDLKPGASTLVNWLLLELSACITPWHLVGFDCAARVL